MPPKKNTNIKKANEILNQESQTINLDIKSVKKDPKSTGKNTRKKENNNVQSSEQPVEQSATRTIVNPPQIINASQLNQLPPSQREQLQQVVHQLEQMNHTRHAQQLQRALDQANQTQQTSENTNNTNNTNPVGKSTKKKGKNKEMTEKEKRLCDRQSHPLYEKRTYDISIISPCELAGSLLQKAQILKNKFVHYNKIPDNLIKNYYDFLTNYREGKNTKNVYNAYIWEHIFSEKELELVDYKEDFYVVFLLMIAFQIIEKPSNMFSFEIMTFFTKLIRYIDNTFLEKLENKTNSVVSENVYLTKIFNMLSTTLGIYYTSECYKKQVYEDDKKNGTKNYRNFDFNEGLQMKMTEYLDTKKQVDSFKTKWLKDYEILHEMYPDLLEIVDKICEEDIGIMEFMTICDLIPYSIEMARSTFK